MRAYVAQFNFRGSDQEKRVGSLSGGERNRVHLARLLKLGEWRLIYIILCLHAHCRNLKSLPVQANVLLLDEPTNDLDVQTLRSLEEAIPLFQGR
mmetsp:Transcript_53184/g.124603  ORF Transcript_53184/g.124603 Transcript_53184/m.124603 type:complete len:95 (+) Transcript_53184:426-710(+)